MTTHPIRTGLKFLPLKIHRYAEGLVQVILRSDQAELRDAGTVDVNEVLVASVERYVHLLDQSYTIL